MFERRVLANTISTTCILINYPTVLRSHNYNKNTHVICISSTFLWSKNDVSKFDILDLANRKSTLMLLSPHCETMHVVKATQWNVWWCLVHRHSCTEFSGAHLSMLDDFCLSSNLVKCLYQGLSCLAPLLMRAGDRNCLPGVKDPKATVVTCFLGGSSVRRETFFLLFYLLSEHIVCDFFTEVKRRT